MLPSEPCILFRVGAEKTDTSDVCNVSGDVFFCSLQCPPCNKIFYGNCRNTLSYMYIVDQIECNRTGTKTPSVLRLGSSNYHRSGSVSGESKLINIDKYWNVNVSEIITFVTNTYMIY